MNTTVNTPMIALTPEPSAAATASEQRYTGFFATRKRVALWSGRHW